MRIRTVKPSFWRSDDITALPMDVRLLFIGLWSYVDDNGVGLDDYRQVAADLFALEEDQATIRTFVRDGLATLSRRSLVVRYKVEDKCYLFIPKWDMHQKVDRPAKPRYPRPPDDFDPSTSRNGYDLDHVDTLSRHTRETLAPVVVEEGKRVTDRGGSSKKLTQERAREEDPACDCAPAIAPAREDRPPLPEPSPGPGVTGPHSTNAYRLVDRTIGLNHPATVRTDLAIQVVGLLRDNVTPELITAALELWLTKPTCGPRTLPALVSEVIRSREARQNPQRTPSKPSTTDQRVADILALKEQMCGTKTTVAELFALPGGAA